MTAESWPTRHLTTNADGPRGTGSAAVTIGRDLGRPDHSWYVSWTTTPTPCSCSIIRQSAGPGGSRSRRPVPNGPGQRRRCAPMSPDARTAFRDWSRPWRCSQASRARFMRPAAVRGAHASDAASSLPSASYGRKAPRAARESDTGRACGGACRCGRIPSRAGRDVPDRRGSGSHVSVARAQDMFRVARLDGDPAQPPSHVPATLHIRASTGGLLPVPGRQGS
jgi:hypothetical protein